MITVLPNEKMEWARCAQAMYRNGRNAAGHKLSAAAALPNGAMIDAARYDSIAAIYRPWLCFNEYPKA